MSQPFSPSSSPGPLKKLVSVVVGIAVLVLGLMFSVVLLAVLVVAGLAVWAWLWWQTRELRRAMREHPEAAPTAATTTADGSIYEGEATVIETHERLVVIEPHDP
jgi:hypothetical protein